MNKIKGGQAYMNVAIDACNIKEGGGATHLCNLIRYFNHDCFSKIYIFCNRKIQGQLEKIERDDVVLIHHDWLENYGLKKILWDIFVLPNETKRLKISILFSPGGLLPFRKIKNIKSVTMCQNILPFSDVELKREGVLLMARRSLQKRMLLRSFKASDGVIFLSSASKNIVNFFLHKKIVNKIVYHGVESSFFQRSASYQWDEKNIKLLYVATIKRYKNHYRIIKAMSILRERGYENINVQFVGMQNKKVIKGLLQLVGALGLNDQVQFIDHVNHEQINQLYFNSSLFVFASSCESFGIPLLEAMASGLPIACSNNEPFPEIAKDAAIYFDPGIPERIADAIEILIKDQETRDRLIERATTLSKSYSCEKMAEDTFSFLRKIVES